MTHYTKPGTHWITISQYVDIDTGEILTTKEAKQHYTIIKKIKTYDYAKRITQYTNTCQRSRQGTLFD